MRTLAVILLLSSVARADLAAPRADARTGRRFEIECSGRHCDIERGFFERTLGDTAGLARSARIVPSFVDGRPRGFKLYALRPGSLLDRLQVKSGDRLETINGMDLSSPDRALELYARLRSSAHFVVALERHGEPITLDYSIR